MNPTTPKPDLQALALTKAIRAQESGGNYNASGDNATSTGAYQYQPGTWKQFSKQILGVDNAPMTPENQNAVTYGMVKTWKDAGMGPAQIAAKWNSGSENGWENKVGTNMINGKPVQYDVPKYVQGVVSQFKSLYPQLSAQYGGDQGGGGIVPTANAAGPDGAAPTGEPKSVSGFIGNVFNSGANLLGGLVNMVAHPVKTVEGVLGTAAGAVEAGYGKLTGQNIDNADTAMFNNMVGYLKQRYGGDSLGEVLGHIGETAYHDPAGMALDLSTVIDGVGGAVGAIAKASKIAELGDVANTLKAASSALNPIAQGGKLVGKVAKPLADTAGGIIKGSISHATGFDIATIDQLIQNPKMFTREAIAETSRGGVLEDVTSGLQRLETLYNETGKVYQGIEKAGGMVRLPEGFLRDILEHGAIDDAGGKAIPFGWKLVPKDAVEGAVPSGYKVVADTVSKFYDPASVSSVQKFVDRWADKSEGAMTNKEFLNMRQEASRLGNLGRELGKNKGADLLGRAIQGQLNKAARPQIPGLADVDALAQPQLSLIRKVTKDLYDAEGNLKDRAASKVALALNKEGLLARLEKVSPGIAQKLEALKAVEDIERSMGIKVGNYGRSAGEIFGVATGNIGLVVGMILSHPKVAMQILKGFGYTAKTAAPILGRVRAILGALPEDVLMTASKIGVINNNAQQNGKGQPQ